MKTARILLVALIASATVFAAKASDDKPISIEQLPAKSQQFIKTHFNNINVSFAKVDKELFDKSYEVFFVDGSKVEFDKKGEWEKVESKKQALPSGIVPSPINDFIQKNHADQIIVKIDRDRRDYEVELNNGLEIKFDLKYNVIDYDD